MEYRGSACLEVGLGPRHDLAASARGATVSRPWENRRKEERHFRVTGLGPQASGSGYQVQVRVPGKFRS